MADVTTQRVTIDGVEMELPVRDAQAGLLR